MSSLAAHTWAAWGDAPISPAKHSLASLASLESLEEGHVRRARSASMAFLRLATCKARCKAEESSEEAVARGGAVARARGWGGEGQWSRGACSAVRAYLLGKMRHLHKAAEAPQRSGGDGGAVNLQRRDELLKDARNRLRHGHVVAAPEPVGLRGALGESAVDNGLPDVRRDSQQIRLEFGL